MNAIASTAGTATIPHISRNHINLQNANTPDIDLERDVIDPDPEVVLGMETGELAIDRRFQINITTIIMSALLFLAVLAWFDFIQTAFYSWISSNTLVDGIPASSKIWYAILITFFILILVVLIYYHSRDTIKV